MFLVIKNGIWLIMHIMFCMKQESHYILVQLEIDFSNLFLIGILVIHIVLPKVILSVILILFVVEVVFTDSVIGELWSIRILEKFYLTI